MRALALLVLCGGCAVVMPSAEPPPLGVRATGAPLAVVDDVKVWVQRDKVGEVRVEDEAGHRLARADVYANQVHEKPVWYLVQGNEQLADEDFFRIAGDKRSLDATQEWRARNVMINHGGRYAFIGGWAAILAVALVSGNTAKTVLTLGGATAIFGGWYVMYWTHNASAPDSHAVERDDASTAAARYNNAHGLSVSRRF